MTTETILCPVGEALYEKLCATDAWTNDFGAYQKHVLGCEDCQMGLGISSEEIKEIVDSIGIVVS
jgi:hypothetical protein